MPTILIMYKDSSLRKHNANKEVLFMEKSNNDGFTVAGTNIEEVKRKNAQSGMSYNEVKEWLAKTTGGRGTANYSDTDAEEVKGKINNMRND